ncbi:MAG: hypothetical protein GY762_16170 [Proteobacteria bacterium]|nr:hypothetical protein [Pseudomonadota bacterium]
MNELAKYLMENLIFDFEGEVTADAFRAFLREDSSPGSRALMQKIIEENGIEDLLITLADCLTSNLTTGITPEVINQQLIAYSEA